MDFEHVTVLLNESVEGLDIKPNGIYIDGTLGGAGHSSQILKKLTDGGLLIGIDQDETALKVATERLKEVSDNFQTVHNNFSNVAKVLDELGIDKVDGMLMDLGVSSYQLDTGERGFSYNFDAKLDMRMDESNPLTAYEVVNNYSLDELHRIIKEYGEDNWAKRIAQFIVEFRDEKAIETTFELNEIIKKAIPKKARMNGPHPSRRTFQAIRIEVNNELGIIEKTIEDITDRLNKGGRIAIITFHSLEDRIVKNTFRNLALKCVCPPELPMCNCDTVQKLKVITRKPILPSTTEIEMNSRSRSAKLRIAERV